MLGTETGAKNFGRFKIIPETLIHIKKHQKQSHIFMNPSAFAVQCPNQ